MIDGGIKGEESKRVEIRILTLKDCDYCVWLKSELDNEKISYANIDAEYYSDFSDDIEHKFQTKIYPIVFIDLGTTVITVLSETDLDTSEILRKFDTIPHLVSIIKSYIK